MSDEAEFLILLEGEDDVPEQTDNGPTPADGPQPDEAEVDALLITLSLEADEDE